MRIEDGVIRTDAEHFTLNSFAEATGVYRQTVRYWILQGKIDLNKTPYDVILDFWNMRTECTECGRRTTPGIGIERWCPHCGQARLKIGITYYVDHAKENNSEDGVTRNTAFETSSKAMCRARYKDDRIVYIQSRRSGC